MILTTGVTGRLSRLVIADLLQHKPVSEVVVLVRDVDKAADPTAWVVRTCVPSPPPQCFGRGLRQCSQIPACFGSGVCGPSGPVPLLANFF